MALCLRVILRKYSTLSYPRLSSLPAFRDQRNAPLYIAPAIELNHNCFAPSVPVINWGDQASGKTVRHNSRERNEKDAWKNKLTLLGNDLYCDNIYLSTSFEKEVFYCAKECEAYKEKETQKKVGSPLGKPDMGQLERIYHKLCEELPWIFQRSVDSSIYHENIIFDNTTWGFRTVGILNYVLIISFIRIWVNVKFASPKFEILKITTHIEDGTVKVRWRIRGVPNINVILFWRLRVRRDNKSVKEDVDSWYDGFSIFYVGGDGLIHKHLVSKVMPNDSETMARLKRQLDPKLALIVGLLSSDIPWPSER